MRKLEKIELDICYFCDKHNLPVDVNKEINAAIQIFIVPKYLVYFQEI
jgi:hypothetical protein